LLATLLIDQRRQCIVGLRAHHDDGDDKYPSNASVKHRYHCPRYSAVLSEMESFAQVIRRRTYLATLSSSIFVKQSVVFTDGPSYKKS